MPHAFRFALPVLALGSLTAGCHRAAESKPEPAVTTTVTSSTGPVTDVANLVDKVKGAVVNITVESRARTTLTEGDSPLDFFFNGAPPQARKQQGLGSGFIIDAQGHVVTNAHVVDGADHVRVKLADERELDAKVKGVDTKLDIALLELSGAKDLAYVDLGPSASTRVGEAVVAIGNPFGLGNTVTTGIVSAKGRAIGAGPYDDFLQTDASINPGNSGGPLFDMKGQVIGMNTAIVPSGQGIGFAIPADEIKQVLGQLMTTGHVERGRLGAGIQDVDAKTYGTSKGALVGTVEPGSPAARAGLEKGDIIVGVDDAVIAHAHDLPRAIARHMPGTKVTIKVRRGGTDFGLPVTLDKLEDKKTTRRMQR